MSTEKEILRIQTARNTIRTKLNELGLAAPIDQLDTLATAINTIDNNGAVQAEVKEGETYTIPQGYHNGSGTVAGVTGGGNYKLQSKTVTPTKSQQAITSDEGFYGLSDVTVAAIPVNYQDVTSVTATAADVLSNKIFVDAKGKSVSGSMRNNGAVAKKLDTTTTSYIIPAGYHNGSGNVKITPEVKSATPTKAAQVIKATNGKVISQVTVNPIPEEYIVTTDADALASDILAGKSAYVDGKKVEGTIPFNGRLTATIDGLKTMSYTIPAGYTSGGTVSLTDEIETKLAAI